MRAQDFTGAPLRVEHTRTGARSTLVSVGSQNITFRADDGHWEHYPLDAYVTADDVLGRYRVLPELGAEPPLSRYPGVQ